MAFADTEKSARYRAKAKEWRVKNPPPTRSAAEQFVNQSLLPRFESHILKSEFGCWLWTGYVEKETGYGGFNVSGANVRTHRVAWLLYRGPIPDELYVLHECDVRHCVNPDHLFLGTHEDNIRDAVRKGRMNVGEASGASKITERQVRAIRWLSEQGMSQTEIAPRFNLDPSNVSLIVTRCRWRHV